MSARAWPKKRMPVSCEPCRQRKIRCPRTKPGPCSTCVRRNVPSSECVYAAQNSPRPHPGSVSDSSAATTSTEELVERIKTLENLLKDHISHWQLDLPDDHVSAMPIDMPAYPSPALNTTPSDRVQAERPPSGRLVTFDSGHVRYQPFHSTWDPALDGSGLMRGGAEDSIDDPLGQAFEPPFKDLISPLPPISQCNALVENYFAIFSPLFHILHVPSFRALHEHFQSDPESVPLSWLALLYVVLSISVTSLAENSPLLRDLGRRNDPRENIEFLSTRYRAAAFRCLQADQYLFRHTLYTLQAMILVIYGISHTHGHVWSLLGMAQNMALSLGCHVDPEQFGLDVLECENRRRCWAGLMMLYTIQSIPCGNIHGRWQMMTTTVRLPTNVDDAELANATAPLPDSPRATEMTYMLFKFRLYEVCSKICEAILGGTTSSSDSNSLSADTVAALEADIQRECETWSRRYTHHLQPEADLPAHQTLQLHILNGYSHQLTLLLHRPFFATNSPASPAQVVFSRCKCIAAARAALGLHQTLHQQSSTLFAPYKWYIGGVASFHAFHAAVVLLTIMASPPAAGVDQPSVVDPQQYQELQQAVAGAVGIFDSMAPRYDFCARAAPALRRLLNSVQAHQRDVVPIDELIGGTGGDRGSGDGAWSAGGGGAPAPLMNALMDNLQPQYWLTPHSVPWGIWDDLTGGLAGLEECGG